MGFTVEWDNAEQSVLRYTVAGQWTWEEFYAARDEARGMVDTVQWDTIHSIIDIHAGTIFPQNSLLHFRRMPSNTHPKLHFGMMVIVGNNFFVRALADILRRVSHQMMTRIHLAPTLEEARAILEKESGQDRFAQSG